MRPVPSGAASSSIHKTNQTAQSTDSSVAWVTAVCWLIHGARQQDSQDKHAWRKCHHDPEQKPLICLHSHTAERVCFHLEFGSQISIPGRQEIDQPSDLTKLFSNLI